MLRLLFVVLAYFGLGSSAHGALKRIGDTVWPQRRPHIYYCRSPNMETFTCWWHPVKNLSADSDVFNYSLTYTVGDDHLQQECPDYVSGGPNSCYFDKDHTRVWEMFCMNVTARSSQRTFTSQEHCLDVADIVEIDPPFNLTYTMMNNSEGELGQTVQISWSYPIASHVHIGWITLVYELRFRSTADPSNWKVKGLLREPQLELLDLPGGTFEVMVRCRSKNNNIWSQWSSPLIFSVPSRHSQDRMLVLILMSGVCIVSFLIIGFAIIPQSKRIKALLLPPIPKPSIKGLDPFLLKKGKMDEINLHFSSFHGYKPPQYSEENWNEVYTEERLLQTCNLLPQPGPEKAAVIPSPDESTSQSSVQKDGVAPSKPHHALTSYIDSSTPWDMTEPINPPAPRPPSASPPWIVSLGPSHPQQGSIPGLGYSLIVNPANPDTLLPFSSLPALHDFYTCVNAVSPSGAVHLMPCLPEATPKTTDTTQNVEKESEKNCQLATYLDKQEMEALTRGGAFWKQRDMGEENLQDAVATMEMDLLARPE